MTDKKMPFGQKDFEIIQRDEIHQGFFHFVRYHLRQRLFKGGWSEAFTRELTHSRSAIAVLPYDPRLDRVILIEQFRPGAMKDSDSPWLLEIPAGMLFNPAESLEKLARDEAMEEAGCTLQELEVVSKHYTTPSLTDEFITIFCGKTDASHVNGIHGLAEEHEDIRVLNLSTGEAFAKLQSGQIKTPPAIISLLWLQIHRERLKATW